MPAENVSLGSSATIRRMKDALGKFETETGRLKGLSFIPRASDIFIVASPKAGTTWMQQITHQLRTRGDMDFNEISSVVPWVELAYDQGQVLESEQVANPRLFKCHCWQGDVPKGGKYIVVLRNPADVAVSFFHFFQGWFFESGELGIEDFIKEFWLARGQSQSKMQNSSYFHHLLSWWEVRHNPNVMIVLYEDMKEDLESEVRKIALFMGLDATNNELIEIATSMSSFEYMQSNKEKFDEKLSKIHRNEAMGLSKDAGMNTFKVVSGTVGRSRQYLSREILKEIDDKWESVIGAVTGIQTYHDLRLLLRKETMS